MPKTTLVPPASPGPAALAPGRHEGLFTPLFFTAGVTILCLELMFVLSISHIGFLMPAVAGGAVVYMILRPVWREWLIVGLVAIIFVPVSIIFWGNNSLIFGSEFYTPLASFGFASVSVLSWRYARTAVKNRNEIKVLAKAIAFIPVFALISVLTVALARPIAPMTYDYFLAAFDHSLGVDIAFKAGQFVSRHTLMRYVCGLFYNCLPITMCLPLGFQLRHRPAGSPDVRWTYAVLGVLGFLMYQFCPATGPKYLFGKAFPGQLSATASIALVHVSLSTEFPRNALPSLHVGWSLLAVYGSFRQSRLLAVFSIVALFFTAFSALEIGEHYFIDLVVAVPLTVAVQLGCSDLRGKLWQVVCCGAIACVWLPCLRSGILVREGQAQVLWSLIAATIIIPAALALWPRMRPVSNAASAK